VAFILNELRGFDFFGLAIRIGFPKVKDIGPEQVRGKFGAFHEVEVGLDRRFNPLAVAVLVCRSRSGAD
jgi:hypothetical protein